MSSLFFIPQVQYVKTLSIANPISLEALCQSAGVSCKASGQWIERQIEIQHAETLTIISEAGDWGRLIISMKRSTKRKEAQTALIVLAYGLHDLVAKESIRGTPWSKVPTPKGRKKTGKALTSAERQEKFRRKNSN